MFITGVALAVAAIPEGLPAVVTITLAIGLQRMARRKSIVRRLPAVETLGCTTVICSDKTGTLTKNEMTIERVFCNNDMYEITGRGYDTNGDFILNGKKTDPNKDEELKKLLEIGTLCNNSHLKIERKGNTNGIV